jgi:phage-related tail fiber protein
MAIIDQLATSNTFSQWLGGTQSLISKMNSLTDGGVGSTFYSNTNLAVSNNVTITGNLTVGNITTGVVAAGTFPKISVTVVEYSTTLEVFADRATTGEMLYAGPAVPFT